MRSFTRYRTNAKNELSLSKSCPINPTDLIVLTIGVVVAALCAAEFIAGNDHRNAERQQKRGHHVALLLFAKGHDCAIGVRAFDAAIPAIIRICAVGVSFTVVQVVLVS